MIIRCVAFVLLVSAWHSLVAAHGHVSGIVINSDYYEGYGADSFPYNPNPPLVIGWTTNDKDNAFVSPNAFNTPDIICHKNATPAQGHATAAAGDIITFIWNTWPTSHVGPVLDYLAPCNGPCETVDKTKLEWFKIDGPAWISGADPGFWAPNVMIANKFGWRVKIPADLTAGNYVLRHEIIALHAAQSLNGAQAYPQCINLQITGSGTNKYSGIGTLGTELYKADDPGIIYNIYQKPMPSYTIPGPPVASGLPISITQTDFTILATSLASTTYLSSPSSSASTAESASIPVETPSTTPPARPSSTSAHTNVSSTIEVTQNTAPPTRASPTVSPTTVSSTIRVPSPSTTAKTTLAVVTTKAIVTPATVAARLQNLYGQCGGSGWTGPVQCTAGATCSVLNSYYAQCVPG